MAKKRATKATAGATKQTQVMYPPAGDAEWATMETLAGLLDELDKAGPISHSIEQALHMAMDLAKVIQRGQTQIDYGATVNRGQRNVTSLAKGPPQKIEDAAGRHELIRREFIKIRDEGFLTKQSAIIRKMLDRTWLIEPSDDDPDGLKMPSKSAIEKATVGLTTRKKSPKR